MSMRTFAEVDRNHREIGSVIYTVNVTHSDETVTFVDLRDN